MRFTAVLLLLTLMTSPCWGWSEGGHHLIAVMAYELLSPIEQQRLQTLLKEHPRFVEDFTTPKNVVDESEIDRWRIGRAGYWSDVARSQPRFHRSTWHYQLGATLTIGEDVDVPKTPGPVSDKATLETQDLYIAQAFTLCRKVFSDPSRSSADRAPALCWICHLVGDSHQPCHAGSLYVAGVFPEGDRGANSIPTRQSRNMHSLWDGLLGPRFDSADLRRRAREIRDDQSTWRDAAAAAQAERGLDPLTWLEESAEFGRSSVYAPEVLAAVEAARRGSSPVATVDLDEEYLKRAGNVARLRAAFAAHRLAEILRSGISEPK